MRHASVLVVHALILTGVTQAIPAVNHGAHYNFVRQYQAPFYLEASSAAPLNALRGGKQAVQPEPPAAPPRRSALPMIIRLGGMCSTYGLLCVLEHLLSARVLAKHLPALVAPSQMLGGLVPASYGLVILVNVVASSFMMMYLSFIPGGARKRFMDAAKKKGDKDAEARFSLPKLYAEGFSQEAKDFNWCALTFTFTRIFPFLPPLSSLARRMLLSLASFPFFPPLSSLARRMLLSLSLPTLSPSLPLPPSKFF